MGQMHDDSMQDHSMHEHTSGGKEHLDPVCGMTVVESPTAIKFDYQGETFYFCSPGCRRAFEKNPDKYLREGPSLRM